MILQVNASVLVTIVAFCSSLFSNIRSLIGKTNVLKSSFLFSSSVDLKDRKKTTITLKESKKPFISLLCEIMKIIYFDEPHNIFIVSSNELIIDDLFDLLSLIKFKVFILSYSSEHKQENAEFISLNHLLGTGKSEEKQSYVLHGGDDDGDKKDKIVLDDYIPWDNPSCNQEETEALLKKKEELISEEKNLVTKKTKEKPKNLNSKESSVETKKVKETENLKEEKSFETEKLKEKENRKTENPKEATKIAADSTKSENQSKKSKKKEKKAENNQIPRKDIQKSDFLPLLQKLYDESIKRGYCFHNISNISNFGTDFRAMGFVNLKAFCLEAGSFHLIKFDLRKPVGCETVGCSIDGYIYLLENGGGNKAVEKVPVERDLILEVVDRTFHPLIYTMFGIPNINPLDGTLKISKIEPFLVPYLGDSLPNYIKMAYDEKIIVAKPIMDGNDAEISFNPDILDKY
jgi:hypothetical protein